MIAMITGNKKLIEFIDVIEDFMNCQEYGDHI